MNNTNKRISIFIALLLLTGKTSLAETTELSQKENNQQVLRASNVFYNLFATNALQAARAVVSGNLTTNNLFVEGAAKIDGALIVTGTITTNNISVTNEVVDNLTVEGTLTTNTPIALLSGGNLLDYGYFYSGSNTTPQAATYNAVAGTSANYTVATGGTTVANAGVYLVNYYGSFFAGAPATVLLALSTNGTTGITGTTVGSSLVAGQTATLTGTAIVNLTAGQTLVLLSSTSVTSGTGGNSAAFSIVRLK